MDILGNVLSGWAVLEQPLEGGPRAVRQLPPTLGQCSHPPGEAPLIPKGGAWSERGQHRASVHSSQGPTPFLQVWSPSHPGVRKIVGVPQRAASQLSGESRPQPRQCSGPSPPCLPPFFTSYRVPAAAVLQPGDRRERQGGHQRVGPQQSILWADTPGMGILHVRCAPSNTAVSFVSFLTSGQ